MDCKDTVLPARTIRKMEAICLSTVSILKRYLTSEIPLSTLSITEVISQVTLTIVAVVVSCCEKRSPCYGMAIEYATVVPAMSSLEATQELVAALPRGTLQVNLLAKTAEALSRWVAGAMAILERERERAHALHRENAKVSRESAMARKELSSMERKMIDAQEELSVSGKGAGGGWDPYVV